MSANPRDCRAAGGVDVAVLQLPLLVLVDVEVDTVTDVWLLRSDIRRTLCLLSFSDSDIALYLSNHYRSG